MTLGQALLYFFREAAVSLVRSWKISLLAVLTITISLFIGGLFLLVTRNLAQIVWQWRAELKVVVYLRPSVDEASLVSLEEKMGAPAWVKSVERISTETARYRFQKTFPGLSSLVEDWGEEPFPPSFEIGLDVAAIDPGGFEKWIEGLRREPDVTIVDDDRDWLGQLGGLIAVVRGIGLTLGLTLLGAATFTIASVIRLTAYLYLEEIAIMRLVGATEFFIRGPFYVEGLLQGLLGGLLAVAALYGTFSLPNFETGGSIWVPLLISDFLPWTHLLTLLGLGAIAGLVGAVVSLRKESLRVEGE